MVPRRVSKGLLVKPPRSGTGNKLRTAILALCVLAATAQSALGDTGRDMSPVEGGQLATRPFAVDARVDELFFYPCNDCHAFMDTNERVRDLDVEQGHPASLEHGNELIWCFSCHDKSDYDKLRSLRAEPIDIDQGFQVCGGCHSKKYRDWAGGAHGKRVADWRGERRLHSCVECHNPHLPSIQPRAPKPPPPMRAGLKPMTPDHEYQSHDPRRPEWEHFDVR